MPLTSVRPKQLSGQSVPSLVNLASPEIILMSHDLEKHLPYCCDYVRVSVYFFSILFQTPKVYLLC